MIIRLCSRLLKPFFHSKKKDTEKSKSSFVKYLLIVFITLSLSATSYFLYSQTILKAKKNLAYTTASSPTIANRYLSFQGRLTDSSGNPITSLTSITFGLYTTETVGAGTSLYTSSLGNSQTVLPDNNGVFSVVIGKTHGLEIPASVFSENPSVFLEITAGGEVMSPRQAIATVAYAVNSETLQGLPPSPDGLPNSVLVLDESGNINLGEASPSIESSSGTLGVKGQAVLIDATNGLSNANIRIDPQSTNGAIQLNTTGTGASNAITATNSNLSTGNLFYAEIGNENQTYNFLDFKNISPITHTLTSRFSITATGSVNIGSTLSTPSINLSNTAIGGSSVVAFLSGNSGLMGYLDTTSWDKNSSDDLSTSVNLLTIKADSGTPEIINIGNTLNFVGGLGLGSTVSTTDTITLNIGSSAGITVNADNLGVNAGAGLSFSGTQLINSGILNTTNTTLTRSGSAGSYTLGLNLGSANTWTAATTFSNNLTVGGTLSLTGTNTGTGTTALMIAANGTITKRVLGSLAFQDVGTTYAVNNGLQTIDTNTFGLGGTLAQNTTINLSSSNLSFLGTGNTQSLFLKANGNVGIGTSNPLVKLDVLGTSQITSTLSNNYAWETGGAGLKINTTSNYNKYQSSLRGSISNTLDTNRSEPLVALDFGMFHYAGTTVEKIIGVSLNPQLDQNNAKATNIYGTTLELAFWNKSNQEVTNIYGHYINPITSYLTGANTATVHNLYGFYMPNMGTPTNVTTNRIYGIYIDDSSATNYFSNNVGIGTTNPLQKLSVFGDASISTNLSIGGTLSLTGTNVSTGTTALMIAANGTITKRALGSMAFDSGTYDNYNHWKLQVNGIGTTNILSGNTVNFIEGIGISLSQSGSTITINNTGVNTAYTAGNGLTLADTTFKFGGPITENTRLNIDTTEVLYISHPSGNIGIGTTNPLAKLHVAGNGNITTSLSIGTSLNVGSLTANQLVRTDANKNLISTAGTANQLLHGDLSWGDVSLGTQTAGNYVSTIIGSSQIGITGAAGEGVGVTITIINDSISDNQLQFNTGQHLTTSSSPTFSTLLLSTRLGVGATHTSYNLFVNSLGIGITGNSSFSQNLSIGGILSLTGTNTDTGTTALMIAPDGTVSKRVLGDMAFQNQANLAWILKADAIGTTSIGIGSTVSILGGNGLTSTLSGSSLTLAVGASAGITVNADNLGVNAGAGLSFSGTQLINSGILNATNTTLTRSGSAGSYTLGLNLANSNTWSVLQTFSSGIGVSSSSTFTHNLSIGGTLSLTGTNLSTGTTALIIAADGSITKRALGSMAFDSGTYDNYNHWKLQINGIGTTNILSANTVNFVEGVGISLSQSGSTITINNSGEIGTPYTAGNGLTLASNEFKLGGSLTENTRLNIGNTEVMFFNYPDGYVGIGTTNIEAPFEVYSKLQGGYPTLYVGVNATTSTLSNKAALSVNTASGYGTAFSAQAGGVNNYAGYFKNSSGTATEVRLAGGTNLPYSALFLNGRVGIGTADPGYTLDVGGTLNATTIFHNGIPLSTGAAYTAGLGLSLSPTNVFSHLDYTSVADSSNSNGTVLQSITFDTDGLGHIVSINTTNLDSRYLQNNQLITLSGDVGGSGTSSINTIIQPDSIVLSTDTTGNYVSTIIGNSQIGITGSASEGVGISLAIINDSIGDDQLQFNTGQHLTTSSSPTFTNLLLSTRLGIGATNTSYALNIVGNGNFTTALNIGSTLSVTGKSVFTAGFDANAASTLTSLTLDGNSGTALSISGTSFGTDINLQNAETIDNDVNGTIRLTATNTNLTGNLQVGGTNVITSTKIHLAANGTAATPGLSFINDTNTGIFRLANDTLSIGTSGLERIKIMANGSVGIGGTTPYGLLDVTGPNSYNETTIGTFRLGRPNVEALNQKIDLNFQSYNNGTGLAGANSIEFRTYSQAATSYSGSIAYSIRESDYEPYLWFSPEVNWYKNSVGISAPPTLLLINETVGINNTAPQYALDVIAIGTTAVARFKGSGAYSSCSFNANGTLTCSSDIRLKKNITNLNYGLNTLTQLRPVGFNWTTDSSNDLKNFGFIAQEVQNLLPELITTDSDGYKQLNTIGLTPIIVKSIQEQQNQIEKIKSDLSFTTTGQININYNVSNEVLASLGYSGLKNEVENANYYLKDSIDNLIDRITYYKELIAAKIETGLLTATNIVTKRIISQTSISMETKTNLISPLSGESNTIIIDAGVTVTDSLTAQTIDTQKLTSEIASVSTLYADNIISQNSSITDLMAEKISSLREELKKIVNDSVTANSDIGNTALVEQSSSWLSNISDDSINLTGNLALDGNLTVKSNVLIKGLLNTGSIALKDNFIETNETALYIQPSGNGSIHLLGNTLVIADNGDVTISGNLNLNGTLIAQTASFSGSLIAKMIEVEEAKINKLVANKIESNESHILSLKSDKLEITTDTNTIIASSIDTTLASSSSQLVSNATAGTAILPAGKTELIIQNKFLTSKSLVYLTPVTSTQNQVLYVKSKSISPTPTPTSSFVIALDRALDKDIEINWWIIN